MGATGLLGVAGMAGLAMATLFGPSAPPAAEPQVVNDRVGDAPRAYDIGRMIVYRHYHQEGTPTYVIVQLQSGDAAHPFHPGRRLNGVYVSIDSRRDDRPDYRIGFWLPRDGDGLQDTWIDRVHRWDHDGRTLRCDGLSGSLTDGVLQVVLPRRCLDLARRPRFNTQTWDFTRYRHGAPVHGAYDVVPRARHWPGRH